MTKAHRSGHLGRNATLAKFRQNFWVPHGDKLAKSVKNKCQLCRLREPMLLKQQLPESRLKPSLPFNTVMLDLSGPYLVRGEVQKRTSGKAYGVIFTDLWMRAVQIEAMYSYGTDSFLLALSRFSSIRGWPELIYSDPGTQLIGAENELKNAWVKINKDSCVRKSAENGLKWIFGPANSPWHQGAVEALVKSAKRAIDFAVHNQRLTVPEFLTVCTEIANLLNERPVGATTSEDNEISAFTPNSLLLGRATAKHPGGWQPQSSILSRYQLVQKITDNFWKKWIELYAPSLVNQQKWLTSNRNLQPGDVVLIADRNTLRSEYRLGLVKDVFPSADGKVRKVSLSYKNYKIGDKSCDYSGAKDTVITRSVQSLALLVPIDFKPKDSE
ncbi:hypothetical protein SNE40_002752 [Patella caerulea]|uniref:Integrase catalytic domain-containing protein n=1 Tax=Patella caerulea TaxID=87958 RepID=A0AAN8K6S3_PATCE